MKKNKIGVTREKSYIYQLDIEELKRLLDLLIEAMCFEKFYICIDEFTQIDRDFSLSIQTKVAQILKQLFFNSNIFVVKIASVWNESRMQNRQVGGIREGIELACRFSPLSDFINDFSICVMLPIGSYVYFNLSSILSFCL